MKAMPSFETLISIEKATQCNIQKACMLDEKDVSFISVAAIFLFNIKDEEGHCLTAQPI